METTQNAIEPKKTPFYKYHLENGAKMVPFAGYMMPVQYNSGITDEHLTVREKVGMFDISHMGEFFLTGAGALDFIQKMTVNDASKLEVGAIQYSCMCYEDGGIVDDLLVYRLKDRYMLVVNAANLEKDFEWLRSHLDGKTFLENRSDQICLLAIQGPQAERVVAQMTDFDIAGMAYYHSAEIQMAGHDVIISRTGYTGEDGYEIYIPIPAADDIWASAIDAGHKYDMKLIGLGARDSLRLEMKMTLYGNDIDQTTTPIEAGLGWIVSFDKGDFIARDILKRQKDEKPTRRLICLELKGRAFPRHGYDIIADGETVGQVTSGTFSPSLQQPIALGYLPLPLTKIGNKVDIKIRDKLFPAEIVKPPFYKKGTHK
ncbi:MAG: glycine cleavage system aminomethyltransferase GcvT [Candidatus Zixiibacteriota bacterium]